MQASCFVFFGLTVVIVCLIFILYLFYYACFWNGLIFPHDNV